MAIPNKGIDFDRDPKSCISPQADAGGHVPHSAFGAEESAQL
jgi:hypothetical protein